MSINNCHEYHELMSEIALGRAKDFDIHKQSLTQLIDDYVNNRMLEAQRTLMRGQIKALTDQEHYLGMLIEGAEPYIEPMPAKPQRVLVHDIDDMLRRVVRSNLFAEEAEHFFIDLRPFAWVLTVAPRTLMDVGQKFQLTFAEEEIRKLKNMKFSSLVEWLHAKVNE